MYSGNSNGGFSIPLLPCRYFLLKHQCLGTDTVFLVALRLTSSLGSCAVTSCISTTSGRLTSCLSCATLSLVSFFSFFFDILGTSSSCLSSWHNKTIQSNISVQGTLLTYFEISVLRHIGFAELSKKITRTTTYHKWIFPEDRDILKIMWKRGEIAPLFHNILLPIFDFHVKTGTRFSLRDKRLFQISEVEIMRVNCN